MGYNLSDRGRRALDELYTAIAQINGASRGVTHQFALDPTAEQRLEDLQRESVGFLQRINVPGVRDLTGKVIGLGAANMIASRRSRANLPRQPKYVGHMQERDYLLKNTLFDTWLPWEMIDSWSKFPDFPTRYARQVAISVALSRIAVGWHGISAAPDTDADTNPLGEDVNIGWLHKLRLERADHVMGRETVTVGDVTTATGAAKPIYIGPDSASASGDYKNIDALAYDLIAGMPTPALAANTAPECRHQRPTENLEIYNARQALKRIACRTQRLVPVRKIKETRLSYHRRPRPSRKPLNQFKPQRTRGFSRCPSGQDVVLGLVDKGAFRVDEVEERGPPDIIQIRARSADFTGPARQRRVKVWKDTTLGAVLSAIAARGGLAAQVHPDLAGKPIAILEQHNKSDHALVQDLGARFDALATWKNRQLLFMPIGSPTTASGAPLPAITLTQQDGWSWSCRQADRTQYDGAEAQWHDPATGQRRTHKTGGTNRKRLKRTYASQAEAQQAATAEAARRARSKRTFTCELAMANMQLQPNAPITLAGWTTAIDATSWLVESVETVMGANGLKQRVELQSH